MEKNGSKLFSSFVQFELSFTYNPCKFATDELVHVLFLKGLSRTTVFLARLALCGNTGALSYFKKLVGFRASANTNYVTFREKIKNH